jgi:hypothetical protein
METRIHIIRCREREGEFNACLLLAALGREGRRICITTGSLIVCKLVKKKFPLIFCLAADDDHDLCAR